MADVKCPFCTPERTFHQEEVELLVDGSKAIEAFALPAPSPFDLAVEAIRSTLARLAAETDSLVAKFLAANPGLDPSEIELVHEQRETSIVVSVRRRQLSPPNHDEPKKEN